MFIMSRFLSNFAKRTFTVTDQVKLINDFLNVSLLEYAYIGITLLTTFSKQFISTKMRECEVWRYAIDVEFENAMEGMEKLVMNRLYDL